MANNEHINKVIYGNDTLIDLTGDTATQADVLSGATFHDASGTLRTGTLDISTKADLTVIAPTFDTSTAYTKGQYVTYQGKLYICVYDHPAGAWASNHFSETTATNRIKINTDDIADLNTLINDNNVCNYLNHIVTDGTVNDIIVTVNDDGSIVLNGTATADTNITLLSQTDLQELVDKHGIELYLNGNPNAGFGASYETMFRYSLNGQSHFAEDIGSGCTIPVGITVLSDLNISIMNNTTFNNALFKPMISDSRNPYKTYKPYAKTNRELTEDDANTVKKSSTAGLLKNDGTVDTSTYLTSVTRGTTSVVGGYTYRDDFFYIDNQTNHTLSLKFGTLTHGAICPPSAGDVADALADKVSWEDNTILGAHNINGSVYYPATSNGVTWSYIDGVFDAYSESGATANSARGTAFVATITAQVILSGCNSGDTGIHIYPFDVTDNARPYTNSNKTARLTTSDNVYNGNEISFYMEKGHSYTMTCRVQTGKIPNHVKFYPLLRLASDPDTTYTPYTMTNAELTNSVIFVATYGVTTYAEINNAFNAGRFIVVKREMTDTSYFTYYLRLRNSSGTYYFQTFGNSNTTNYYCYINSSGTWTVGSTYLAPLASPAFTGTPTAPTATAGTNTTQIATTAFVQTAIDNAVTSALSASY